MAIVPYKQWEEMNRWKQEQRPRLPPDPNIVHTVSLQKDLSSVLADDDISEAEKSQKYGETLHKFKLAHKKALQKIQPAPTVPAPKGKNIQDRILESVPLSYRRKAEQLLSWLEKNSKITWDEEGRVKVYGKPIANSNIVDLINNTVRGRKKSEPSGWQTFAQNLKESNVPRDYVGNKKRWDYMHEEDEEEEEEEGELFGTPRQNIAMRIKESVKKKKQQPWVSFDEQ